jgi:hypothetical protein
MVEPGTAKFVVAADYKSLSTIILDRISTAFGGSELS